jgi:hypothetical protein
MPSEKRCWRTNRPVPGRPPLAEKTITDYIPAGLILAEEKGFAISDAVRVSRSDLKGTIHVLEFWTVKLSDLVEPNVTEIDCVK